MEVLGTIIGAALGIAIAVGPTWRIIWCLLGIGVCLFIAAWGITGLASVFS